MPWILPVIPPGSGSTTSAMAVPIVPQFDAPFRLGSDGRPVVVEQGSPEDVGACIYNILACPQGAKLGDPTFGRPELTFQAVPLDTTELVAVLRELEPRAEDYSTVDVADVLDVANRHVAVFVDVAGSPASTATT